MITSVEQALTYLQGTNQLQSLFLKLLHPNTTQSVSKAVDRSSKQESLGRQLIEFCIEHQLIDHEHFQQWLNQSPSIFPRHEKLNHVFHFIETHYRQSITLSDVAHVVGYSPAYLTDLMRRETGKPVNDWIIERRLAEACHLLKNTTQTVNQIAEAVGYQSPGHFFRQFRQRYGQTPQSWRNAQC